MNQHHDVRHTFGKHTSGTGEAEGVYICRGWGVQAGAVGCALDGFLRAKESWPMEGSNPKINGP